MSTTPARTLDTQELEPQLQHVPTGEGVVDAGAVALARDDARGVERL